MKKSVVFSIHLEEADKKRLEKGINVIEKVVSVRPSISAFTRKMILLGLDVWEEDQKKRAEENATRANTVRKASA